MPEVECRPGQINQVFMNILANAVQAIEGTGEVRITTGVTTSVEGNAVAVSIRDTGMGMSPEVMRRVFEPFFTTKEVGKGTGLGMAISFGIIEKHHGTIEVQSELQRGTEFTVRLPLVQPRVRLSV